MFDRPKNLKDLRTIKTARTLTAINSAVDSGLTPLVKSVLPNPEVHNMVAVYQHRTTKKIKLVGDCRMHPGEEYECVIPFKNYYQYSFPSPFAAYLLPPDLKPGEQVWLDDIIEDIVAIWGNQGYHPRLLCGEATWNGKDLIVNFDPAKDAERLIG
ncbi:MAG: hypothetical protein RLZZ350_1952 [Verrucomicrobiota bacterium]|jgi:hypothetical protein